MVGEKRPKSYIPLWKCTLNPPPENLLCPKSNGFELAIFDRYSKLAAERELVQTREEVAYLRHELAQLKRMIFGTRSERFEAESPDQLGLFLRETAPPPAQSETTTTTRTQRKEKRKPVRQPFPSHLPRETVVIEPEGDTSLLKRIGAEVTETLDYHPPKIIVIRRERPNLDRSTVQSIRPMKTEA